MLIERRQAIQEIRECHFTGEDKLLAGIETGPTLSAAFQPADLPVAGQVTRAASPPELDGASRLPYSNERMAANYREFLTRPLPRAFAISESGEWGGVSGRVYIGTLSPTEHLSAIPAISSFEAGKRAVDICERRARGRCFLYAVDNRVVYVEDQEKPLP